MEKEMQEKTRECLHCPTRPCQMNGCPLKNRIPDFIQSVKEEKLEEAYQILSQTTVLSSICGRICPHEKQCQGKCVRGIKGTPVSIGQIEAFVGDYAHKKRLELPREEKKEGKVAVVGSGPAGLECSAFLAKKGYSVTLFEKQKELGGILTYGIPEFRLPKEVTKKTIEQILTLGMTVEIGKELGKDFTLSDLEKEYDAIFLGIGANCSNTMGIKGEELEGVVGGNELLEKGIFPDYTGKKVAVIGGGNVAMDTARTIRKERR